MKHGAYRSFVSVNALAGVLAAGAIAMTLSSAKADEGGVSFWVPGLFGSLAAVPQPQPGWALGTIYYHTSVSAGADVGLAREFAIGRVPANLTANLNANLNANADLAFIIPSYAFATPVFGGQAGLALLVPVGGSSASLNGTLSGSLSAGGISIPFFRSDSINGSAAGNGDLVPLASIKWNNGVHNFMTYITGDIPVGVYNSQSLANVGIGHGVIDAGGGYTYFNPQTGHEFTAAGGFTYNFVNPSTNYQNGIDFHVDMAAAQFLTKQVLVGAVGYVYNQVTADRGSAPILGPIESRVVGVGPQLGYIFPVGNMQGYLNLKAYFEFDAHDRPSGWNTWLTFSISPPAPPTATPPPSRAPMIYK
jgi:hypothetical protein